MDPEKVAATYRVYEIYPRWHPFAGRRRFKRVGISWRKGTAKTEWAAEIVYAELHPDAPVRFNGWERRRQPWAPRQTGPRPLHPDGGLLAGPSRGAGVRRAAGHLR
jgi:hypothetical protein